jgi:cyclic beta-1,2-glucan synthetase
VRRCSSATRRAARSGRQRRCPPAAESPTPCGTGRGIRPTSTNDDGRTIGLVAVRATADPVKIFRLALHNTSRRPPGLGHALRRLGARREPVAHGHSRRHRHRGRPRARSSRATCSGRSSPERVAFLDLWPASRRGRTLTGDRTEFIGRNGSLERPAALGRDSLSGRTGGALDPCGAVQVQMDSRRRRLAGRDRPARRRGRRRLASASCRALPRAGAWWTPRWPRCAASGTQLLGTVTVRTPDPSMDLVLNRWLLYQTLSCRVWGRSAFYQSSGAFGFRDQLQDTLALLASAPRLVRAHLLHAASRQFVEGDVQHWWHEPGGQGVRTRFSDDRLWLSTPPCSTSSHRRRCGARREVPFLDGARAQSGRARGLRTSGRVGRVRHALRALRRAVAVSLADRRARAAADGHRRLERRHEPRRRRRQGRERLARLVHRVDPPAVRRSRGRARGRRRCRPVSRPHVALTARSKAAWDGDWYRRAYFDDGTPLGSKRTPSARSTRSRSRGRCSPAR